MKLLGISRGTQYSPNMADSDSAIFSAVVEGLRRRCADVTCFSEAEVPEHKSLNQSDGIFTMARSETLLRQLDCGIPCLNSPQGILTCSHKSEVARLFENADISQPRYATGTAAYSPKVDFFPLWLKNGDGCAQSKKDTVLVENERELNILLHEYTDRGVKSWLLQEHVCGDLLKFYGVEGTEFFDWDYASMDHSKFGLESVNGEKRGFPFDILELKNLATQASKVLGVPIYGGDCVVDSRGRLFLIDFNDWPSFSRCRNKAAEAIVDRILKR